MGTKADKYISIADRLAQRIRAGDYHVRRMPAERDLAAEVGVSHATARKAIQKLVDEGLLVRLANGRLAVPRSDDRTAGAIQTQIALLVPAWESSEVMVWHQALIQLCSRFRCAVRLVHYHHLDDPVVFDSIESFDGTFLLPIPDNIPDHFMGKLLSLRRPVVVLSHNWTEYGVPSLRIYPPVMVQKLLDHLLDLGHERIDCLNTQPEGSAIKALIAQWNLWRAGRGLSGQLINEPVQPYVETLSAAYNVIARRIREGQFDSTALLCTTERVASGAIRALADAGIRPGQDVAVCSIGATVRNEYSIPSITSLEDPDPKPYVAVCLEWMLAGKDRQWNGPMLLEPQHLGVAVRQSTVPDTDSKSVPLRIRQSNA